MSTALTKIYSFTTFLANVTHNLSSDQLKVALTNTAHNTAWTKLSDLTEVSYTNLLGATPLNITTSSSTQSAGTYSLKLADLTLEASGGTVGPFRYVYIYDNTAANKDLIGMFDYGSAVTLNTYDQFVIDFHANGLFTLA
jgi:hypothetical protein